MTDWHLSQRRLQVRNQQCDVSTSARVHDALRNPTKAELREMLAEAAANTAKMSRCTQTEQRENTNQGEKA